MGFYGNITNSARTQFQFDQIYHSRAEMDRNAGTDGVYTGRYVLVNYDDNQSLDSYLQAFKRIESVIDANTQEVTQVVKLSPSLNDDDNLRFVYVDTEREAQDTNTVYLGELIIVPADGYHNIADPSASRPEWWVVSGYEAIVVELDGNPTVVKYATFTPHSDPYSTYYNEDVNTYGTSRGYDSTVWQKTYQNGVDKYIMVAELNTVMPILDVEAEAPKMVPLSPHFDTSSTNIYYKLHWAPNWGLRIKAANPDLTGPVLSKDGLPLYSTRTKMSADSKTYPSDERVHWYNTFYNEDSGEFRNYYFNINEEGTQGDWISTEYKEDGAIGAPAAIYYNKEGFNPEVSSYGYVPINLTPGTYVPRKYYKKINGQYKLANEQTFDASYEGIYYEKIDDCIQLEPSGRSGHMYNAHTGSLAGTVQEDTQELSIMLPGLGNTIAAIWDLIYGSEEINDGPMRNTDIAWETARSTLNRRGLRLVSDYNFDNQYTYQTKNVDTIAGALNSVHDLMGMIITSARHADLMDNIDSLDFNRIYFDQDTHTFNRKGIVYDYTPVADNLYEYVNIGQLTEDKWAPKTYYTEQGEITTSFNANQNYYLRRFKGSGHENAEYAELPDTSNMQIFDGSVYAYKDYVGADGEDFFYGIVSVTYDDYQPNKYYIKSGNSYVKDTSPSWRGDQVYYEIMYLNHPRMADYVRDLKYYKNKVYYRWDEIDLQSYPNLSGAYEKNKYYILTGQGDYVLSTSDSPDLQEMYFTLYPNNLKKLSELGYDGIYVPGKYLYYDSNEDAYAIDGSLEKRNVPYFLLDTNNQIDIGQTVYTKQVRYVPIVLVENDYIRDFYYIYDDNLRDYAVARGDWEDRQYFIKEEILVKVTNQYYTIDPNQQSINLIQFHDHEFFHKTATNEFRVISRIGEISDFTNVEDIYVLRKDWQREEGESNGGTYILNISDYSRPDKSAMILQTQFYEPGKFHYLHEEYTPIQLDSTTYVANKYYVKNGNTYTLSTGAFNSQEPTYYLNTSDYILDTYPKKTNGRQYFTINSVGDPVDIDFFDSYEYYQYNETTGEYSLITDNSTIPEHIYEKQSYYVLDDEAKIYTKGMPWNFDTRYVPATVTLATRTEEFGLIPFSDFARNINTMHGLILKINNMLDFDNEDTRDIRTVKGALNTLSDRLAQLSTLTPGNTVIVDDYGRLRNAKIIGQDGIRVEVNSNINDPTVTFSVNLENLNAYDPLEQRIDALTSTGKIIEQEVAVEDEYADERSQFWADYNVWLNGLVYGPGTPPLQIIPVQGEGYRYDLPMVSVYSATGIDLTNPDDVDNWTDTSTLGRYWICYCDESTEHYFETSENHTNQTYYMKIDNANDYFLRHYTDLDTALINQIWEDGESYVPTEIIEAPYQITNLVDDLYPIGSIYTTSSNEEADQPATLFGGKWVLIHKGFKALEELWQLNEPNPDLPYQKQALIVPQVSEIINNVMTRDITNEDLDTTYKDVAIVWDSHLVDTTQNCQAYIIRNKDSIKIRLTWYSPANLGINNEYLYNDVAKGIAQLNLKYLGLNTYNGWSVRVPGVSDYLGSVLIVYHNAEGLVYLEDILPKSDYAELYGAACSATYELFIPQRQMDDAACDEFVWKRTE